VIPEPSETVAAQPRMMDRFGHVHWVAPATMLGALLVGILLVLGHHFFNAHLAGTTASSNQYNVATFSVSKQQISTTIGTAFAFVVKAFFGLAISISYIQVFWMTIASKRTKLSILDTITSAFDNGFVLFNAVTWWRYPLLFLLAITSWYSI
jgi:hypothetical protein